MELGAETGVEDISGGNRSSIAGNFNCEEEDGKMESGEGSFLLFVLGFSLAPRKSSHEDSPEDNDEPLEFLRLEDESSSRGGGSKDENDTGDVVGVEETSVTFTFSEDPPAPPELTSVRRRRRVEW